MAIGKYQKWIEDDGLLLLEAWARDGLTDEQIAHNMDITAKTLYEYKKKYSKISEALKKGKEVVDVAVENALYKRALGYKYEEVTEEPLYNPISGNMILDDDKKPIIRVTKRVTKHMPPDVTAQIFWLKNRKPADWRDKQELDANVKGGLQVIFEGMPDADKD